MAVSPGLSGSEIRPSRRSFPNLTHLSLAPLSSRFPIDDDEYEDNQIAYAQPTSSYIQGKSAPTTPGILSRSRHGRRSKSKSKKISYAHESYFLTPRAAYDAPLTKAKSAGTIQDPHTQFGISAVPASPLQTRGVLKPSVHSNDEWLHRAGLLIASESRESKGQSWLASRESSTSLVQQGEDAEERYHKEQEELEDRTSTYQSRRASRAGSRAGSAKPSRRGSRVGSKPQLFTPMERGGMESGAIEGYFDELAVEPDFVIKEDEGVTEDEAEVQRLSKVQGFGFGGIVDRLIGFPLFNVEEPSEDETDDAGDEPIEHLRRKKEAQLKRREEQLARTADSSALATNPPVVHPPRQDSNGEGGWKDAAWLLSIASKVVL